MSETYGYAPRYSFQFNKGTIRTEADNAQKQGKVLFQFHKGTIRTKS